MKSLLETLQTDWENYSDIGIRKFLDKLLVDYKDVNYYDLMNVEISSSVENINSIKTTYRKLCLILHPDKSNGKIYQDSAAELFKLVNSAYETLTDSKKERDYRSELQTNTTSTSTHFTSSGPQSFSSSNTSAQNFSFSSSAGNVFFTTGKAGTKKFARNIEKQEVLSFISEDILVEGSVYGSIKTKSGDITVTGDVHGSISNMSGDNTINGSIYGSVSNMSGDNTVNGNVYGSVSTISGNNNIKGNAPGRVITTSGKNKITGNANNNTTGKNKSSTSYGNVHIFNGSQQMSPQDLKAFNDAFSGVFHFK